MDESIKVLLKALAQFQFAALQKDPAKARYNKRFVLGMKQTTNAIRAGTARLVLLPPDIEDSLAVTRMVETLLLEAQRKDIPVIYCLSRRRLGKAFDSNMRQSAAAVYNPDGAYDEFKKIMLFQRTEQMALAAVKSLLLVLEEEFILADIVNLSSM